MDIVIDHGISIPRSELLFTTSRSSGPGGQHVNKVSSRVTLHFNICQSTSLTDQQKRRMLSNLRARMTKDGVLRLHSQKYRSQSANRADLVDRLRSLLLQSVKPKVPRIPTKIPKVIQERRLQDKRRHGRVKLARSSRMRED